MSRKDAKAQRLRQRKNSRKKAQKTQKENGVFRGIALADLQVDQLITHPLHGLFYLFFCAFCAFSRLFLSSPDLCAFASLREILL
jgi:hypothetical protein